MRLLCRNGFLWACCLLLGAAGLFFPTSLTHAAADSQDEKTPFPAFYTGRELFVRAIVSASSLPAIEQRVSGLTVPHHLLAADRIAQGFARIRAQSYSRIILLSPDHYRRGKTPVSVPQSDFRTCFGMVPLDKKGAAALYDSSSLVSTSRLFSQEHGVQALLPFIAAYFPDVPVLPMALSISMRKEELESFFRTLLPLLGPDTLLIQSTDFSHYLTWEEAREKDAETLRAIMSGDPERLFSLHQPHHLDSRAAQYLQLRLQKERYGASPMLLSSGNSCEYQAAGETPERKTTSYMVLVFSAEALSVEGTKVGH